MGFSPVIPTHLVLMTLCAASMQPAVVRTAAHYASQTWGATHAHLPPTILAMNGFAGSPVLPITGQLARQSLEVNVVGSVRSQQFRMPQPYRTAVGTAPLRGERSTVIVAGVFPAVSGRLIQPAVKVASRKEGVRKP